MGKGDDPNCAAGAVALLAGADGGCPAEWGLPEAVRAPEATIAGVGAAAGELADAIRAGETVAVFCDYDPDGTFSGELIRQALAPHTTTVIGMDQTAQVRFWYARRDEGFGVSRRFVQDAAAAGAGILLTVDCGSGAEDQQAIRLAHELGMRVIVCDHHHPHPDSPADHHLNPRLHQAGQDGQESASVAALKLAWELDMNLARAGAPRRQLLGPAVYLAAFGARADMMDMDDPENAALLAHGQAAVSRDGYPAGLEHLVSLMGKKDVEKAYKTLGGCLNLPKRTNLAAAADVAAILAAEDAGAADEPAKRLIATHQRSKAVLHELTSASVDQARADLEADPSIRVLVSQLDSEGARAFPGHAGMVANRVAQDRDLPAVAIAQLGDGTVKWSARLGFRGGSHQHRSLLDCLAKLQEIGSAGGHPAAVSGSCAADQADQIVAVLRRWAARQDDWPAPPAA